MTALAGNNKNNISNNRRKGREKKNIEEKERKGE